MAKKEDVHYIIVGKGNETACGETIWMDVIENKQPKYSLNIDEVTCDKCQKILKKITNGNPK